MLRAIRGFRARPQIVRRRPGLVGILARQGRLFSLGSEGGLLLLLLRRRVRTRDIEASILHEVKISIAATRLAASGKFRVAFAERRGSRLLARRLFGDIGTFLEIRGPARP